MEEQTAPVDEPIIQGGAETEQERDLGHEHLIEPFVRILIWPVLVAGVFLVSALHNENELVLQAVTYSILVVLVLIQAARKHATWMTTASVGAIVGVGTSVIVAIYKLIVQFDVIYVFNLFTEPAITGVFMGIATGFLYIIVQLLRTNIPNMSKGGEHDGNT